MGGTKNRSPAQVEKSQHHKQSGSKKQKLEGGTVKASIRVILTENQASRIIRDAKVITVYDLARQTGVKISAANAFLKEAVKQKRVKVVGGYSGHYIYQPITE